MYALPVVDLRDFEWLYDASEWFDDANDETDGDNTAPGASRVSVESDETAMVNPQPY